MDRHRLLWVSLAALVFSGTSCKPAPLTVAITSPQTGTFTQAGSILVAGTVGGGTAAELALTVNGVAVPVAADKTWNASVPLDPSRVFQPILAEVHHTVSGKTKRDRVTVVLGDSVVDGGFSTESVALRLTDRGLDAMEPRMGALVELDLATLIPVGTFLTSFPFGLLNYDVYVASPAPSLQYFHVHLDALNQAAEVEIDIDDLLIWLFVDAPVIDCDAYLLSSDVRIFADFALEPNASDPRLVDATQVGSLSIQTSGFWIDFTSGDCVGADGDYTGDVVPALIAFLSQTDAEGNTVIAAAIEDALNDLALAETIGTSLSVSLDAPMSEISEDDDGVTLGADTAFTSVAGTDPGECTPPAEAPDLLASYHVAEPFPTFATTTPTGGLDYDIGIGLSSSAFNQLLMAQVECGLLASDVTEIDLGGGPVAVTAGVLALFDPAFGTYPPTTPFRIELRPALAPVFTGAPGPSGEIREMRIGHLLVRVVEEATGALALAGAVDARFGVDLAIAETEIAFTPAVPLAGDLAVTVLENPVGANVATLEAALPLVLAPVFPTLAAGLEGVSLPTFLGFSLDGVEVSDQGQFLGVFADFVSGDRYWRRYGNQLRAFGSAVDAAANTGLQEWYAVDGSHQDSMLFDGALYWRRYSGTLEGYVSPSDLATRSNPVAVHPADGNDSDAMMYDGTHYWRRYADQLEGYSTAADMAARTNLQIVHTATGFPDESLLHDGIDYWRRVGPWLEAYPTAADLAAGTNLQISLPAVGAAEDAMMFGP